MKLLRSIGRGVGSRGVLVRLGGAGLITATVAAVVIVAWPRSGTSLTTIGFVQRSGPNLTLDGQPFRFAGTNNYYLIYSSKYMVDDVLNTAATSGFAVVRTWGWLEQAQDGVKFQSWDGSKISYNDGATGLEHLDYVVAAAGKIGLKLVIPFTNNWSDFGGMDAYVGWAGDSTHDAFYTDPKIRQWFRDWIAHLLNHVNSITGIAYKDDPTIMAWELANEPSCVGSALPASDQCTTATITSWAADMSTYVKSIDSRHLLGSGSNGFLDQPGATDFTLNGSGGVDEVALANLPNIDLLSYHLYPEAWGKDSAWATTWITQHISLAKSIGKPSMLGEFAWKTPDDRNEVYKSWTDTVYSGGGTGALFWMLSGAQDDGTPFPDYDGATVYCPSPVCATIGDFSRKMLDPAATGS